MATTLSRPWFVKNIGEDTHRGEAYIPRSELRLAAFVSITLYN